MNQKVLQTLEFDKIINILTDLIKLFHLSLKPLKIHILNQMIF